MSSPTPLNNNPTLTSPSSRLALLIGYLVFRIPASCIGGTLCHITVAPIVTIENMDVWVSKPVFFEESTDAHLEISTYMYQQLNQYQQELGSGATKVLVDVHSPKASYSATLALGGICDDLALSAVVDGTRDVYFGTLVYQWVKSISVGGHLQVVIENMFGKWGRIEVPCLGLNTQIMMATISGHHTKP